MKKALTLLLAAALSGLASAVTLDWSNGYNSGSTASLSWGTKTKLEVAVTFTINDVTSITGRVDFFSVFFNTEDSASNSFYIRHAGANNNNQALRLVMNDNGYGFVSADPTLSQGSHTLTLIFQKSTQTTGSQSVALSYQLDGGTETSVGTGALTLDVQDTITLKVNDGTNLGSITGVEAKLVPEPTVLALLALGVAGVALRRKVA